jgi:hypothetical protein
MPDRLPSVSPSDSRGGGRPKLGITPMRYVSAVDCAPGYRAHEMRALAAIRVRYRVRAYHTAPTVRTTTSSVIDTPKPSPSFLNANRLVMVAPPS